MPVFAMDWAISDRKIIIVDEKGKTVNHSFKPSDTVLIESGFPKTKILQAVGKAGIKVVNAWETQNFRSGEKTDENDALTIMEMWKKQPRMFRDFTEKDRKEVEMLVKFKMYENIMKQSARMKNIGQAYVREFGGGNPYKDAVKDLDKSRANIIKLLSREFKREIKEVDGIKGLGPRYLIGLLLYAHPKRFGSLSKFLSYCGYKDHAKESKRYSRNAKMMLHRIAHETIMHKDKKYYQLYLKIKEDLSKKNNGFPKYRINNMAINRLSTFIAKEVYERFKA